MDPSEAPVFVDDSGRRRTLARRAGRLLVLGFVGYLGLLGAGFARSPHLGRLALPTFGLPSLVPAPESPATVLGEAASRAASGSGGPGGDDAGVPSKGTAVDTSRRAGPT